MTAPMTPELKSYRANRTISAGTEVKPKFFRYQMSEGAHIVSYVFSIWDMNRQPDRCAELMDKRMDRAMGMSYKDWKKA